MCNHYWQYADSPSRIRCARCRVEAERAGPDPDGRWHALMPVAMKSAMRSVKWPSSTQAAPHLA